jgi:hypothetical protein
LSQPPSDYKALKATWVWTANCHQGLSGQSLTTAVIFSPNKYTLCIRSDILRTVSHDVVILLATTAVLRTCDITNRIILILRAAVQQLVARSKVQFSMLCPNLYNRDFPLPSIARTKLYPRLSVSILAFTSHLYSSFCSSSCSTELVVKGTSFKSLTQQKPHINTIFARSNALPPISDPAIYLPGR